MKIGIVIPLKAKSVSKDWTVTCSNVESTVRSVLAQKDKRYESIVVGHDKPEFMIKLESDQKCSFVNIGDRQPPDVCDIESENQLRYEADRCTKILKGIMELKRVHPDIAYWFALDADDLVHDDFVGAIQYYDGADAIILENGYSFFKNIGIITLEDEFSAYCGSSAVLSDKLIDLPKSISGENYRSIPYGSISHVFMKDRLSKEGFSVEVPMKRLIMYVRDNGENISNAAYCNTIPKKIKKYLKMFLKAKKIDTEVRRSFGIH